MAHLTSTLFVGPDEPVRTFDRAFEGGRLVGLYIGDLAIQFRDTEGEEGVHRALAALLRPIEELERASAARLADRP